MNTEQIAQICQKHNLGKFISEKSLGQGENHHNKLITTTTQKFVLRYALRDSKNIKREYEFMQKVPKGFAPKPIACGIIDDEEYSLQEFIVGNRPEHSKETLIQIATKMAKLHIQTMTGKTISVNIGSQFAHEAKELQEELPHVFSKENLQILEEGINYLKKKTFLLENKRECIVHSDIIYRNSIQTDTDIVFIDWEWGGYREQSRDIGGFYYPLQGKGNWQTYLNQEEEDLFFKTYCDITQDDTEELKARSRLWQVYVGLHDYFWFTHKTQQENFDGEDTKEDYAYGAKKAKEFILSQLKTN